jgi:hypothetical protein
MDKQIPDPGKLAAWQDLVDEAVEQTGYHCDEKVEHYLVLTLDHFATDKNLSSAVVAMDFLLALNSLGREGGGQMRKVGDECLLLAGLFPERAARKHVSVDYFVGVGQAAYNLLTSAHFQWIYDPKLFNQLSIEFPNLITVLQSMRNIHRKFPQ